MEKPKSLFKFESINEYSLRNLKNAQIFFNCPSTFNDPFDSSIQETIFTLSNNDLVEIHNHYIDEGGIKSDKVDSFKDLPDNFRGQVERGMHQPLRDLESMYLNELGCSCFTEDNTEILMWSHYANGHKGICLEFNTSGEPFNKLFKVEYSNDFPSVSIVKLLTDVRGISLTEETLRPLLTKYTSWEYEKEWRVFHKVSGTLFGYDVESLKAVYFGVNIDYADLEIVCLILLGQNPEVKFYRSHKGIDEYKVDFEEFTYTPFVKTKL